MDDQSVCHNETQLIEQCEKLLLKFKDLTVEEFIDGPEFSVLISGTFQDSNSLIHVYPPAGNSPFFIIFIHTHHFVPLLLIHCQQFLFLERAFMETLGTFQKFVSFDRNWDETKLAHDYLPVKDLTSYASLQDLAKRVIHIM